MEQNINPNISPVGIAGFNQAYFQQIRLNEIFLRIDRCYISPMQRHPDYHTYNYLIIANDLVSAFETISAKLEEEEKKAMEKKREAIETLLIKEPPHKQVINCIGKKGLGTSLEAWRMLNKLLLDYRCAIEMLMERYGFGNPSKKDPTKASIEF